MKISRKVVYEADLNLTDEQIEAFNIVNSVVADVNMTFRGHLRALRNNENQYHILSQDLRITLDTLNNLVGASNFTILLDKEEEEEND